MGGSKGGGGKAPVAEPAKRRVAGSAAETETQSLLRRRGLQSTKMGLNSLGGGNNLGGR